MEGHKFWRTLVRVNDVGKDVIYLIVPAWDAYKIVRLEKKKIPKELLISLILDKRFHAQVNIGVENADELIFTNFEIE